MPRAKAVVSPVVKRGPGRPKGSRNSGGATSAIASLRQFHGELAAQKQRIDAQIAAVENAIRAMTGAMPMAMPKVVTATGRAPRSGSLKEYIIRALTRGGTMAVKDITAAVMNAGYPTKNKTLAKSVGNALADMPNVSKVGRGQFRLA